MTRKLCTKLINIIYIVLQISLILAFLPQKKYMSSGFSAAILLLYLFFLSYEHKKGIIITNFIRISVTLSLLANGFLGDYLQLYNSSMYFDKILHVFGTFSFSAFIFLIVERQGHFQLIPRYLVFIFVLLLGSFLGTVFEIAEFLVDIIFKTVNQSSNADTNIDMICDILGAALAGIFAVSSKNVN